MSGNARSPFLRNIPSSPTLSETSFELLYLSDYSDEDSFRVPVLGPVRHSLASEQTGFLPSTTSSPRILRLPSLYSHPPSPMVANDQEVFGDQTAGELASPPTAEDRRTTLDMLDCAFDQLSVNSRSARQEPSPSPPPPDVQPARTATPPLPDPSIQSIASSLPPILTNHTIFNSTQEIASITVTFVTSSADRGLPTPQTPPRSPRQSGRSAAAPPLASDSDESPPRAYAEITRRKHIKTPLATPVAPSTPRRARPPPSAPPPTPVSIIQPTPSRASSRASSRPISSRASSRPIHSPSPTPFSPPLRSRAPLFLSAVGGFVDDNHVVPPPPDSFVPLPLPPPLSAFRSHTRFPLTRASSTSTSSLRSVESSANISGIRPTPLAGLSSTSSPRPPSSVEEEATRFRTPSPVPIDWIMGPGNTIYLPQQLPVSRAYEYWVVSWGRSPGVYYTAQVASSQSGSSPYVITQTFTNPRAAMSAWIRVYHERQFCCLRPELGLPTRAVREVPPAVDTARFKYLHFANVRPSNGFCVVIRGLVPGMYASWLVAGPLVVGIREALFVQCANRAEAQAIYEVAQEDGLVMALTLVVPLPSVYLQLG